MYPDLQRVDTGEAKAEPSEYPEQVRIERRREERRVAQPVALRHPARHMPVDFAVGPRELRRGVLALELGEHRHLTREPEEQERDENGTKPAGGPRHLP